MNITRSSGMLRIFVAFFVVCLSMAYIVPTGMGAYAQEEPAPIEAEVVIDDDEAIDDDAEIVGDESPSSDSEDVVTGGDEAILGGSIQALNNEIKPLDDDPDPVVITVYTQASSSASPVQAGVVKQSDIDELKETGSQSSMHWRTNAWNVTTSTSYITLQDVFDTASVSPGASDVIKAAASDGFSFSNAWEVMTAGKFFPDTGRTTFDQSTIDSVTPILALTFAGSEIGATDIAADTVDANEGNQSTNDCPRLLYGSLVENFNSANAGNNGGNRFVSSVTEITVITGAKVTFDADGGSSVLPRYAQIGGTVSAPPAPTKADYDFDGWYTSSDGGTTLDSEFSFTTPISSDLTLYAKWVSNPVVFTVYTQASVSDTPVQVRVFKQDAINGLKDTGSQSSMHWRSNAWNVTTSTSYVTLEDVFDIAGVDPGDNDLIEAAADDFRFSNAWGVMQAGKFFPDTGRTTFDQTTIDSVTPILALTFAGSEIGASDTAFDTAAANAENQSTSGTPRLLYGSLTENFNSANAGNNGGNRFVSSVASLTIIEGAKVTYDSRGGSSVSPSYVKLGDKATAPTAPTKTSDTFFGWYLFDDESEMLSDTAFDFATTEITEDITLYAKWGSDPAITVYTQATNASEKVEAAVITVSQLDSIKESGSQSAMHWRSNVWNVTTSTSYATLQDVFELAGVAPGNTDLINAAAPDGFSFSNAWEVMTAGKFFPAAGATTFDQTGADDVTPILALTFAGAAIGGSDKASDTATTNAGAQSTSGSPRILYGSLPANFNSANAGNNGGNRFVSNVASLTITEGAKVTFEADGGSPVLPRYVAIGAKATAPPAPTKAKYDFGGWYESADGGATLDETAFDFAGTTITGDITLYAKWISPVVLTVYTQETSVSTPVQAGVITQEDIDRIAQTGSQSSMHWRSNAWNVTTSTSYVTLEDVFDVAGVDPGDNDLIKAAAPDGFSFSNAWGVMNAGNFFPDAGRTTFDQTTIDSVTPILALTFAGAEIGASDTAGDTADANEENQSTSGCPRILYGSLTENFNSAKAGNNGGNRFVSSVASLTIIKGAKVTFDTLGGSSVDPRYYEVGAAFTLPVAPTLAKYDFMGWHTSSDSGVTLSDVAFTGPVTADITLYAKWERSAGSAGSGDFDDDGIVTAAESVKVSKLIASGGYSTLNARQKDSIDMDGDKALTMVDAILVLRKAAGL